MFQILQYVPQEAQEALKGLPFEVNMTFLHRKLQRGEIYENLNNLKQNGPKPLMVFGLVYELNVTMLQCGKPYVTSKWTSLKTHVHKCVLEQFW